MLEANWRALFEMISLAPMEANSSASKASADAGDYVVEGSVFCSCWNRERGKKGLVPGEYPVRTFKQFLRNRHLFLPDTGSRFGVCGLRTGIVDADVACVLGQRLAPPVWQRS